MLHTGVKLFNYVVTSLQITYEDKHEKSHNSIVLETQTKIRKKDEDINRKADKNDAPKNALKFESEREKKNLKKGIRHDRRHFVSHPYLEILYKMLTRLLHSHPATYDSTRVKMLRLTFANHRLPSFARG